MKKLVVLAIYICVHLISNAQQYNTVIINGQSAEPKNTLKQWYTINTNNSDRYPIWETFFSNGVVVYGRGEYLNEYLVNMTLIILINILYGKYLICQEILFQWVKVIQHQAD